MNDRDIVSLCDGFMKDARKGKQDFLERAEIAHNFRRGAQWTATEISNFRAKAVEPVTINHCLPVTNIISGLQRQNQREIRVHATKGSSDRVARVLGTLSKHVYSSSRGEHLLAEMFLEGITAGEDYIRVDRPFERTPQGELKLRRRNVFRVLVDPLAEEYDLNETARFVVDLEWRNKGEVEALFPGKAKVLKAGEGDAGGNSDDKIEELMSFLYGDEYWEEDTTTKEKTEQLENRKYRYLVKTFWWKEWKPAILWNDLQTGEVRLLDKVKDMKRAVKASDFMPDRFKAFRTKKTTLHKSEIINTLLLQDTVNPFGEDLTDYPFVRFAAYWEDGYVYGVIDNLIGPQREQNMNRTQATRLLNQTTNAGWLVGKLKAAGRKTLEMFGAVPGVVIDKSEYGGEVERIKPNTLSTGHVALSERSAMDIKQISSVNEAMQGEDTGSAESGRAISLKQRQGMMAIEPILDNFDRTLILLGSLILKFLQKTNVYTDTEIRAIIAESDIVDQDAMALAERQFGITPRLPDAPVPPDQVRMGLLLPQDQQNVVGAFQKATQQYQRYAENILGSWDEVVGLQAQEMIFKELKADEAGEYSVVVDVAPSAPTMRMADMLEISEIAKLYPGQVPIETYINHSGIQDKEQIKAEVQQHMEKMLGLQQQAAASGVAA